MDPFVGIRVVGVEVSGMENHAGSERPDRRYSVYNWEVLDWLA